MILSSALGTLTGLLGSGLNGFFKMRNQKIQNEHELKMTEAETKAMIAEKEANIRVTEAETTAQIQIAEQASFDMAQKFGNERNISSNVISDMLNSQGGFVRFLGALLAFLLGIIDLFRTSIRPAITVVLMVLTVYMYKESWDIIQANKTVLDVVDIIALIEAVNYLTFTVIGYWFGERGMAKAFFNK